MKTKIKKTKIINITGRQQLDIQVNELISEGWQITSIHTSDAFQVKMIKESEYGFRNRHGKIPILGILSKVMLCKIAGKLKIEGYTKDRIDVLIKRIEGYKTGYVIKIYEDLTN